MNAKGKASDRLLRVVRLALCFAFVSSVGLLANCSSWHVQPAVKTLRSAEPELKSLLQGGAMLCSNYEGSDIALVSFATGRETRFSLEQFGFEGEDVEGIAGPRDGHFLLAVGLNGLILGTADRLGKVQLRRLNCGLDVEQVAFGADPQFVFVWGVPITNHLRSGTPALYRVNVKTGAKLLALEQNGQMVALASSGDGKFLVASYQAQTGGYYCQIIEASSMKVVKTILGIPSASFVYGDDSLVYAEGFVDMQDDLASHQAPARWRMTVDQTYHPIRVLNGGAYFFVDPEIAGSLPSRSATSAPAGGSITAPVVIESSKHGWRKSGDPVTVYLRHNDKILPVACFKGTRGSVLYFSYD
jgi:hypothetical protein